MYGSYDQRFNAVYNQNPHAKKFWKSIPSLPVLFVKLACPFNLEQSIFDFKVKQGRQGYLLL